jgi:hypothetical protein
MSRTF